MQRSWRWPWRPGVGSGRKPPIFLKAGDQMACTCDGVGTLRNDVSK